MALSEQKLLLLATGINRGGCLRYEDAIDVYSGVSQAVSALQSLRAWGFIRLSDTPGIFYVVKAPSAAFRIAENLKHERDPQKKISTDDTPVPNVPSELVYAEEPKPAPKAAESEE
jgi:hypothetical protein